MRRIVYLCAAICLMSVRPASAEFIGTFVWQSQPFCNRITLNVSQAGDAYILEGYDNLCGAERHAPVAGTATINPNGTVGLGLLIVNTLGGEPTHMDIVINLPALNGAWSDSAGNTGTFVFNGADAGSVRPANAMIITAFGATAQVIGRYAQGTPAAPTAAGGGHPLLYFGAHGYDGADFALGSVFRMVTTEAWTPLKRGTAIDFYTTENGTIGLGNRMRIDHDGQVGIGTASPAQLLDVLGNVRVGTGTTGCVEDRDATVIAGVCASDARFKRNVVSFEPMLNKVAALRPVHFYWRADEFPSRAFGSKQSYGLMAQEVEAILPELVTTDDEGYKAVNYSKLPLLALQAIKELKSKNDALEQRNAEFERRLAELEARIKR